MLSAKVLTRADHGKVASYYGDGLDDYYAKEGESQEWQGKGADALGLKGEVDSEAFRRLLGGEIGPNTVARTGTRDDAKQRIGIDFTFSAPKSVSLQALVGGDAALIRAHDEAVRRTIEKMETLAQARTKEQGQSRVETTGNLVVAKFRHETSREKEPTVHTHAVVLNLTQRADGEWRALKNDQLIKQVKVMGASYRAELADILQKEGRALRFGKDGTFELAGYSREQIEKFSTRGRQVEERLSEQGLSRETATAAQKQAATMQTRAKKEPNADREALFADWREKAKELGIDFARNRASDEPSRARDQSGHAIDNEASQVAAALGARQSVRYAISHLSERQAAIGSAELHTTAVEHGVGRVTLSQIEAEVKKQVGEGRLIEAAPEYRPAAEVQGQRFTRSQLVQREVEAGATPRLAAVRVDKQIERGNLVQTEQRYTTPIAVERERAILKIERDGRDQLAPIVSGDVAREHFKGTSLNDGQQSAATLMLSSANRVVGVQGFAGTGKSHMLDEARNRIEAEGYNMRVVAPYGSQVKALRELNVQSNTVASFLKAQEKGIDGKTVLVVDEAGTVPARQMQQLLRIAEQAGARVVLQGDIAQTKAIEAGKPFDQLQAAGMSTAGMTEIMRQQNPQLREAVELAAVGKSAESVKKLSDVVEITDHRERRLAIADTFAKLSPQERDQTIIVSGTNEARREINNAIRERLGTEGQGLEHLALTRRDTTQAERRHSKNYDIGDTVQPERDYPKAGLKKGELYTVLENGPGNVLTVRAEDGGTMQFSPKGTGQLSVYRTERLEFAEGDKVRVTRNDAGRDLSNGDRFTVADVRGDSVTITNGKRAIELPTAKPVHLDHAYATTVHSSQGITANRTLIDANTTSRTTAKDVYYVAISRAKHTAQVFTNSIKALPDAVSRISEKAAALDVLARAGDRRGKRAEAQLGRAQNGMRGAEAANLSRRPPEPVNMDRGGQEAGRERDAGRRG